jgi:ParB family transcriptional regulator, chromosome partitioning protein
LEEFEGSGSRAGGWTRTVTFGSCGTPRIGPKEDPELQRQIEANEGIFEPLLLEPHPDNRNKFRIIDGDRRWTNSKVLVEVQKKEQYRHIPAEITDRTLTDEERLRVWIYIHRQRREWDTKEKEMMKFPCLRPQRESW